LTDKREIKAIRFLIKGDNIKPISQSKFLVRSQSNPLRWHEVTWNDNQWRCECEDYIKRKIRCKHIYAVSYFLAFRDITIGVKNSARTLACKKCHSTKHLVKYGIRHNQSGPVQKLYCKRCKKWSTNRVGFEKMKNQVVAVVSALDLYFRGISLRQISEHLRSLYSIDVSYGTIHNWVKKYVELVHKFTKDLRAITSERWHADETLIKVRGRQMVMWSLLDSETRDLIAQHISRKRSEDEAAVLFRKGKRSSKTSPNEIITDGLKSYEGAIESEFNNEKGLPRSSHKVLHIVGPLVGKINNNKVERFQGSVKGRLKAMGQLNSFEGAKVFANGYQIHYNFIREHKALNGRTPAEMTNMSEEKMNWQKLIEKAAGNQTHITSSM
jgi:putative transposase